MFLHHCIDYKVQYMFQEVIMMLEQSTQDFKSLILRLHMMKAFEDAAKDGDRYI